MDYPDVPWPCHFCRSGARVLWKFIDQVPVHHPTGTVVLNSRAQLGACRGDLGLAGDGTNEPATVPRLA